MLMKTHEFRLQPDHSINPQDYLPETHQALSDHNYLYLNDPQAYFQRLEQAQHLTTRDGRPYLLFGGQDSSTTDLIIAQLPFANRLHPANTAEELAGYATKTSEKLPKNIKPNSSSQALKHFLTHTAILGVSEARDSEGRHIPLAVVTSPSADFGQPALTKSQRGAMKRGDLEPYAEAMADIAEEQDAGNVHLSGYSFGAAVATRASRIKSNFTVKSLTIGEPSTHRKRSIFRVMGDYTVLDMFNGSSGHKNLEKTPDTGWLQDAQLARSDLARNGDGSWLDNMYANGNIRTNLQIARALGKPTLESTLHEILADKIPTTLFVANDSLMTRGILEDLIPSLDTACETLRTPDLLQLLTVRPIGAVAAKHIVGEIPALYADYLARGIKHAYTTVK